MTEPAKPVFFFLCQPRRDLHFTLSSVADSRLPLRPGGIQRERMHSSGDIRRRGGNINAMNNPKVSSNLLEFVDVRMCVCVMFKNNSEKYCQHSCALRPVIRDAQVVLLSVSMQDNAKEEKYKFTRSD